MGAFPWRPRSPFFLLSREYAAQRNLQQDSSPSPSFLASSWNSIRKESGASTHDEEALIQISCTSGELDTAVDALHRLISPPSIDSFIALLKACLQQKSLLHAKKIHSYITHQSIQLIGFLGDYLVVTLAKCGAPVEAWQISHALPRRTVFSWSAIISAYVDCGYYNEALKLYQHMQEENVEPNKFTLVSLFKACGLIPDLSQGKRLHDYARRRGCASDAFVGSSLVSMYGKCGTVAEAEDAFCALSQQDIVTWTSLLSAYVEQGQGEKALLLYRQMQVEGMGQRELILVIALQACGILAEKEETQSAEEQSMKLKSLRLTQALHADARNKGYTLHADARNKGYTLRLMVGNTLVSVYGKCKSIAEAESTFCAMSFHDVVSWNAMLSAYVEMGEGEKALQLYCRMQEDNIEPEQVTFVMVLQACGILAKKEEVPLVKGQPSKLIALEITKALHMVARRRNFAADMVVGSTLLGIYGKCGDIVEAEDVFGGLSQRNIVSWTAMLFAYVEQGHVEKALSLYRQMQEQHVSVDAVTFISILQTCGETGSLELCKNLHFNAISSGYDQISTMQTTLVYTYGSCGSMENAQSIFDGLLTPDVVSWSACIDGHASEGNSSESLNMFENFMLGARKPDDILLASVLSACSYTGLLEKGLEYFESMSRHYGLTPNLKHHGIVIDLLGRAGDLKRIENLLTRMPLKPDLAIWLSLLGACRTHGHVHLARQAFNHAVILQPKGAAAYVLMANIYANAGLQICAAQVERFRQKHGAWRDDWTDLE